MSNNSRTKLELHQFEEEFQFLNLGTIFDVHDLDLFLRSTNGKFPNYFRNFGPGQIIDFGNTIPTRNDSRMVKFSYVIRRGLIRMEFALCEGIESPSHEFRQVEESEKFYGDMLSIFEDGRVFLMTPDIDNRYKSVVGVKLS